MEAVIPDIPTGEYTSEGKPYLKFIDFNDIKDDFLQALNSDAPSPLVGITDEGISKIDSRLKSFNPNFSTGQFNEVQTLEAIADNFLDRVDTNNSVNKVNTNDNYREFNFDPNVVRMLPQAAFTPSREIVMEETRKDMESSREIHRAELSTAKLLHEMAWGKEGGYNLLGW